MSNVIHVVFNAKAQLAVDEINFDFSDLFNNLQPYTRDEYKELLEAAGCSEFEVAYELKQLKDLFK